MHKFFTATNDASIYLQQPEQNTGRDEILEVGKLYYGSAMDIARTLIKFPITQVSEVVLEESASLNSLLNSNSASVSTISSSWYTAVSSSLYWSSSYSTSLSVTNSLSSSYSASWNNYVTQSLVVSASYNLESASLALDILNWEYVFNYKTYLNLKSANSEEIPLEYTIYANAVSGSWSMGTGTKFDNITYDGVTWYYMDGSTAKKWTNVFGELKYTDYPDKTQGAQSGSIGSIYSSGGGIWYSASMASQSFSNEPDDIRMDVTDLVKLWISGSNTLPNNGFILHHHPSASISTTNDGIDYGVLKFFSKETNTIYEPKLELVWDDSSFVTGSLSAVTGSAEEGYKVVLTNIKNEYPQNQKVKIRVKGRDVYPLKSFSTTFEYDQSKYLPTTTYYQLEDYKTGEIIFPFGNYTKISCDSTSNYFIMDLNTLPINRTYKLKLKIIESGISTIIDDKLIFEIV